VSALQAFHSYNVDYTRLIVNECQIWVNEWFSKASRNTGLFQIKKQFKIMIVSYLALKHLEIERFDF